MLEITGPCVSGLQAIEILEHLQKEIEHGKVINKKMLPDLMKAINRVRYEVAKGEGKKVKEIKPIYRGYKTQYICSKCGSGVPEAHWRFCPNCGTKILS